MFARVRKSEKQEWLRAVYAAPLLSSFRRDSRNIPFRSWIEGAEEEVAGAALVDRWCEADPTPTKSAAQWLIRLTLDRGLAACDLPKARLVLTAFFASQSSLPSSDHRLGRYETLEALTLVVIEHSPETLVQQIAEFVIEPPSPPSRSRQSEEAASGVECDEDLDPGSDLLAAHPA